MFRPKVLIIPLIAPAFHTLLVVLMCMCLWWIDTPAEHEAGLFWNLIIILDIPTIFIVDPIVYLFMDAITVGEMTIHQEVVIYPAVSCLIAGGIQYYVLAWLVCAAIARVFWPKKKPAIPPCAHCGYDLRGLRSRKCPECGSVIEASRTQKRIFGRIQKAHDSR